MTDAETMEQLTRSELINLVRILYGENVRKLYSEDEQKALGDKLYRMRDLTPRELGRPQ